MRRRASAAMPAEAEDQGRRSFARDARHPDVQWRQGCGRRLHIWSNGRRVTGRTRPLAEENKMKAPG